MVRANDLDWVPAYCVWETTLACNLACRHCGSSAGQPRPHELDTREGLALLDDLAALGTREITFSGGEVFVRPDWRTLFARARQLGLASLVVSNGVAITRALADELAGFGVDCVSLSIDGGAPVHDRLRPPNPAYHDSTAGFSSFAGIERAIRNLNAAGVPVAAITQVSRTNLAELPVIAEFLGARAIEGWQIQLTNAMGRAGRETIPILEPGDLPRLYAFIRAVQDAGTVRTLASDCLGYFGPDEPRLRGGPAHEGFWQGCQAGLQVLGITSDGGVKGCLSLPDAYLEGNLRERPLAELWSDPRAFAYNRRFDPASLTGACHDCAFGRLCRAGCHSFAATAQDGDISRYDHCIRALAPAGGPDGKPPCG